MTGNSEEVGPKKAPKKPFASKRSKSKNSGSSAINSVKDILASSAPGLNIDSLLREYRIKKLWPECVGAHLAKNSAPTGLVGRTLNCVASSSAWMSELNYRKEAVIKKLNSLLKEDAVSAVIFRIGSICEPPRSLEPEPAAPLTDEDLEFIEMTTEPIKNDALKEAVRKAMKVAIQGNRD